VTEIGDEAFLDCEKLASIDTARLVSMIGTDAFKNTAFYFDESNWENGVLYLENYLVDVRDDFSGKLTVKEGTVQVADRALAGHTGITEVALPSTMRVVGNYAFTDCLNLTAINLDLPGIQIGKQAFAGCVSLTSVIISTDDEPTMPEGGLPQYTIVPGTNVENLFGSNIIITNGTGNLPTQNFAPGGAIMGGSVSSVFFGFSKFAQQSTLDPNFIYCGTVGTEAFNGCTSLSSVTFRKNVGKIDGGAFSNCTSLASVDLSPITVASKEGGSFVFTPGSFSFSSEVALPSTFEGCTSLTSVTLPKGLTSMPYTFADCTALTSFTVPEGVKFLDNTFRSCTNLTSVKLPSTLIKMEGTFRFCPSLTSIEIPETVTEIGTNTFRDCESLDSLYLPDAVTEIGQLAFCGMKKSAVISIGKNVTHIGPDAAAMLYAVTYRGTVEEWNQIDLDANWMGDRVNSSIAIYCTNGQIGEEPEHDQEEKPDKPGGTPTVPDKPEEPIPEWVGELEGIILPNGTMYLRHNGVTIRYANHSIVPSPISFDELQKNPPANARPMTERELADLGEKMMEQIREFTSRQ
jgi:hypothetical protein